MTTIQLRRYTIETGRMDDFIAWWRSIIEPRAKYGEAFATNPNVVNGDVVAKVRAIDV